MKAAKPKKEKKKTTVNLRISWEYTSSYKNIVENKDERKY